MPTIYVTNAGRNAGELPLAPTLTAWTIIDDALKITATLHRVAVGATGRSPATQTMRKHRISPQGDAATYTCSAGHNAGELPLAPTLHVCACMRYHYQYLLRCYRVMIFSHLYIATPADGVNFAV